MRKWMIVLAIFIAAGTFGSISSNAQVQIQIGPIQGSTAINFTGTMGGSATMTFGACPTSGACTLNTQDQLVVGGLNSGGFSNSTFISSSTASFGLTTSNGANWSVVSGPTFDYSFSSAAGTLTGVVAFTQVNTNGAADIVGTLTVSTSSGTLSSYFAPLGTYPFNISAQYGSGNATLEGIFNGTNGTSASATASESGAISATPEPASMLLYGTGIFLIGGILRRRLV